MHTLTPTMRNSHDGTTTPDPAASGPASDRPTAERSAGPAPRLALARPGSARALLDGAWWPYSRDLTAELPGLIEALDARWDRITRVTVNRELSRLRRDGLIAVDGGTVRILAPELLARRAEA